jgi:hypothetical protein
MTLLDCSLSVGKPGQYTENPAKGHETTEEDAAKSCVQRHFTGIVLGTQFGSLALIFEAIQSDLPHPLWVPFPS